MKLTAERYLILVLVAFLGMGCASCQKKEDQPTFERQTVNPIEGMRIAWDYSSMQRIAPQSGRSLNWAGYPRVRRLSNQTIMVTYETQGSVEWVASTDNGLNWSAPQVLFEKEELTNTNGLSTWVNKANGELIELANGTLLAACNYRPVEGGILPFSIALKRSDDEGNTWSSAEILYQAGNHFEDGCWEPSFLQLPSGEVHLYFANEGPFTSNNEQNISLLRSFDNGISWTNEATTVCFRSNHRDGMPVPVLLDNEIVVAIEDNASGQFKPYTVRTSLSDNWKHPVLADSDERDRALKAAYPDAVYAGAPYLVKTPSGPVLLSYQTTSGRSNNWELSTMEVAVGDEQGRQFSKITQPFNVPLDREAKWNSLSMWDDQTVVAAATTSFHSPSCEVWLVKGHLIPELTAKTDLVEVDGKLAFSEWKELPLFVGHQSNNQLIAGVQFHDEALVLGARLTLENSDESYQSEVNILIDTGNFCLTSPDKGVFKWTIMPDGLVKAYEGNQGKWKEIISQVYCKVKDADEHCYEMELSIPFEQLGWQKATTFRLNAGIGYVNQNGTKVYEWIANSTSEGSYTWCSVEAQF